MAARCDGYWLGPTPMLYFAATHLDVDGAIQVTGATIRQHIMASRWSWTGSHFLVRKSPSLVPDAPEAFPRKAGADVKYSSIFDEYVNRFCNLLMLAICRLSGIVAMVPAGQVTDAVVERLTENIRFCFPRLMAPFPTIIPIQWTLKHSKFCGQRSNQNRPIWESVLTEMAIALASLMPEAARYRALLTAYLAQDVAKRHPGETMLLDVKSSQLAVDMMSAAGADAAIWKTGTAI